jgi:lipoprotein NlpI
MHLTTLFLCGLFPLAAAQTVDELLERAAAALEKGRPEEARTLAGQAVARDPKSARAYYLRGLAHAALRQHAEAVADFDRTVALQPRAAEAYQRRGGEHFKLGQIEKSIADFDKFLELRPAETPGHWQRGISYYYAGRFEEGRKQFEGYESVDRNDVENAVWRYLCMARTAGIDKARTSLLKIGHDRRVPMMEIYALFAGRAQPADVLAAARAGQPTAAQLNERLFYAHLYLGLYHEAAGDQKQAREHLTRAAEEHKIVGHYMWDVARVHVERLRKAEKR